MEMEKREVVAGDLFLELAEIEKLCKEQQEENAELKWTAGAGSILTIICC